MNFYTWRYNFEKIKIMAILKMVSLANINKYIINLFDTFL